MTTYPTDVATEVSIRRPDLAAGDAISAVLTTDPTLTADEVIDILDDAADEYAAGRTISIPASRYEDADDCLTAAANDYAAEHGLIGWDLSPRWGDDERTVILLDVPA